jgi:diguanylate cyclase (GGDEF)-like protein
LGSQPGTTQDLIEILIVEDSRTQAAYLSHILEQNDYGVYIARSAAEAIGFLNTHTPTLVISDIDMPGVSGYELCRRIKTQFQDADFPVILLTSLSDPEDVIKALECGADNFITKPYDDAYLLARISYILHRREIDPNLEPDGGIKVVYRGQPYKVEASRQQMLDLLLSTYETAVQKNLELLDQLSRVRELSSQLAEAATHDELTGLHNYGFFIQRLADETERSHRYGRPLALIMGDVDHFKQVNDKYGHQTGNAVLQAVASILAADVRSTDVVARYGGEEFAIIMPETTWEEALVAAEHIRAAIAASHAPGRPDVTISLGISEYQILDSDCTHLIKRADSALYQAKKAGRNRALVSTGTED